MEQEKLLLDVNEKPKVAKWIVLAIQHVFAMFGATILVPILVNSAAGETVLTIPVAFRKFFCLYCTTSSSLFKRRNSRGHDRSYGSRSYLHHICYYY